MKSPRLLLYPKSVTGYNVPLAEVQNASLAYHTYPLPDAVQPRLVLKGILPNFPVDGIQTDLEAQESGVVQTTRIANTDEDHTDINS